MKVKIRGFIYVISILLIVGNLYSAQKGHIGSFSTSSVQSRPEDKDYLITVPEVWNYIGNYGSLGGDYSGYAASGVRFGLSWPGGAEVNNYYLWAGYFTVGAKEGGRPYTTYTTFPPTQGYWSPTSGFQEYIGPGKSVLDVVVSWDDHKTNPRNSPGQHLGIQVIIRTLSWPNEPYNDFIAHEIYIIFRKDSSDIIGVGDELDSVYVGMWYDCDISGASPHADPHLDDLVGFSGWVKGEWQENFYINPNADEIYLEEDTFVSFSDGINDHYFVWGVNPEYEHIADSLHAQEITINTPEGEKNVLGYLIPYGMSYIYDGDSPGIPGDDVGEGGISAGYQFGAFIYAPLSPSDSLSVIPGQHFDTLRIVRPWSHQWWNWESDPATPEDVYNYLAGRHSATQGYRFAPHPYDLGAVEFDYRFLNTVGPFTIRDGDTLKLVWIAGVGQGLNGGNDAYWGRGWLRGARQTLIWAYRAYYAGNPGDPAHPTPPIFDPAKDNHWKIPIPPPAPLLTYSQTEKGVLLIWDNKAESFVDPLKGRTDFIGYKVYRSVYEPRNFKELAFLKLDEFGNVPHSYLDTTTLLGFPYYYVVTAVDEDSLESPTTNYKKTPEGKPVALYVASEPAKRGDLSKVKVVPNPFVGSAEWTATEFYQKIEFQNLPPVCVIYIFTFSGKLVKKLVHNNLTGTEAWDLLNEEGIRVSSGLYFYKIETPEGESKVGQFMILD